jgi:hypothetical protein
MTDEVGAAKSPVQPTWQKPPIVFPTTFTVEPQDEDRLGCIRSALWCCVVEVAICLAGIVAFSLWLSLR